jgi:hypothetical protein
MELIIGPKFNSSPKQCRISNWSLDSIGSFRCSSPCSLTSSPLPKHRRRVLLSYERGIVPSQAASDDGRRIIHVVSTRSKCATLLKKSMTNIKSAFKSPTFTQD